MIENMSEDDFNNKNTSEVRNRDSNVSGFDENGNIISDKCSE